VDDLIQYYYGIFQILYNNIFIELLEGIYDHDPNIIAPEQMLELMEGWKVTMEFIFNEILPVELGEERLEQIINEYGRAAPVVTWLEKQAEERGEVGPLDFTLCLEWAMEAYEAAQGELQQVHEAEMAGQREENARKWGKEVKETQKKYMVANFIQNYRYSENFERVPCINGMKSYEPEFLTGNYTDRFYVKPRYDGGDQDVFFPTPIMYFRNKTNIKNNLEDYYNNKTTHEGNTKSLEDFIKKHVSTSEKYVPKFARESFDRVQEKLNIAKREGSFQPKERVTLPDGSKGEVTGFTKDGKVRVKRDDGKSDSFSKDDLKKKDAFQPKERVTLPDGSKGEVTGFTKDGKVRVKRDDGRSDSFPKNDLKKTDAFQSKGRDAFKPKERVTLPDGSRGIVKGISPDGRVIVRRDNGETSSFPQKNLKRGDAFKKDERVKLPDGSFGKVLGKKPDGRIVVERDDKKRVSFPENKLKKERDPRERDSRERDSRERDPRERDSRERDSRERDPRERDSRERLREQEKSDRFKDPEERERLKEEERLKEQEKRDRFKDPEERERLKEEERLKDPEERLKDEERLREDAINVGDNVELSDGSKGVVIEKSDNNITIKKEDGETTDVSIDSVKKTKPGMEVTLDLKELQDELDKLKKDKDLSERVIQELSRNLRRYKKERHGFESEERQRQIIEYERKQKELSFIKNALQIKTEQIKSVKILIEKEFERNREIESNREMRKSLEEKESLKKMKNKMKDISKKQHEKQKKLDMKEKDKEIEKLKQKAEKYEKLYKKKSISRQRDRRNEMSVEDLPFFTTRPKVKSLKKSTKEELPKEKKPKKSLNKKGKSKK
tara:strand:- start:1530 stop:4055 length:2526 start_codon:yes stop_codon:yes gene_type:complete